MLPEVTTTTGKLVMNISKAHQLLGHISCDDVREMCKHLVWKIMHGQFKPCPAYVAGKAKKRTINPTIDHQIGTQEIGRRIFIYISSTKIGKGLGQKIS